MEFLMWEIAFAIVLSLLLPSVFLKLLSVTPNFEAHEKVGVIGCGHDHGVKSDSKICETDEVVQIVGKIDEFGDKSILGKIRVPKIVDVDRGSPKIRNSKTIDEESSVYNEIELVNLAEDHVVDGSNKVVVNISEIEVELVEYDSSRVLNAEKVEILQFENNYNEIDESGRNEDIGENKDLWEDEDDWEEIERTELEKRFGAAVVFVESRSNDNSLSDEVKMKLHGYYRIATQGPCHEPQPLTLKFSSARAKWIAWRQLGIMSPEQAMEQYISLLSESIPYWIAEYPSVMVFYLVSFCSVGLNVMNQSSFILFLLNLPI
ncbi:acyl-CoA-binding domain-containing protein 3 isoform X1 [Vigna angularis]|uniref:acyl-CoA-binding domain-containing protein 3 isoform X1 n=1 Tax=Phaseolus angularis TaxID=3914 RepID=UPI000809BD6B|nr:acyl-CoA-binding domain-containing protein 3 isoform X1 [Vigna angularis]